MIQEQSSAVFPNLPPAKAESLLYSHTPLNTHHIISDPKRKITDFQLSAYPLHFKSTVE